jgi:hypothetical protein
MAIKLAKDAGLTDLVSGVNPITTVHATSGGTVEVKLYLFNDDATKTYQSIQVDPMDTTGGDESSYIQLAPDNAGVAGTYLAASAPLSVSDITTVNSPRIFWAKITTPTLGSAQNKTDIFLRVTATEFAV